MNKSAYCQNLLLTVFFMTLISACGFTVSVEERIASAKGQMQEGQYRAAMIELKNVLAAESDNATARSMLARVSLGLGDFASAEKELERAAEFGASEATIRTIHLDILVAQGRFSEVLALLGTETGGLTEAQQLFYRGEALLGLGNIDAAKVTFEDLIKLDPTNADAEMGIARAEIGVGEYENASARLTNLSEMYPRNAKVWHTLGIALVFSGELPSAENALVTAEELILRETDLPRYASILAGLVETELTLDKHDAARRNLEKFFGIAGESPTTLFLAARLARSEGDIALAVRHLQSLLNIDPNNGPAQLLLANSQMLQGNYAQAASILQRIVARSPENYQARKMLARTQLQQSRPDSAIEALVPALEALENDPDLYTIIAQANFLEGDSKSAIEQFQLALDLAPDDDVAKVNLAAALVGDGQLKEALEILENAAESSVNQFRREQLLVAIYEAEGRREDAESVVNGLLEQSNQKEVATLIASEYLRKIGRIDAARSALENLLPESANPTTIQNSLAQLELMAGNFSAAGKIFTSVLESESNNVAALVGLAQIAEKSNDNDEVLRLLALAVETNPGSIAPKVLYTGSLYKQGKTELAEQLADELVAIAFQNSSVATLIANVYLDSGRVDDAIQHFNRAVFLNPNSELIFSGLARALLADSKPAEARTALHRALEMSPSFRPALSLLTMIEIKEGRLSEATNIVDEYLGEYPDDTIGMILAGEVHFHNKNYDRAEELYGLAVENGAGSSAVLRQFQASTQTSDENASAYLENWLTKRPDDTVVRSFLAQHYLLNSRGDEAIEQYEMVLQSTPENAIIMNNLAWQYQQNGSLERAIEVAEAAYALNPQSGSIADTLGWIYRDTGQIEKSASLLKEAVRLSPNNGEISYHYAVILVETGKQQEALLLLQLLLSSNAEFPSKNQASELMRTL